MSKVSRDSLIEAVGDVIKGAQDKKRKFRESVKLQIGLKNYDPKRTSVSVDPSGSYDMFNQGASTADHHPGS